MSTVKVDVPLRCREVVVLGAGVVGLTTAMRIQETGRYAVTVVASQLPSDAKSIEYTSHWAGAHHVGFPDHTPRQQQLDRETFDMLWELSAPDAAHGTPTECLLRIAHTEYYESADKQEPHVLAWMPDFALLPQSSLPPGAASGVSFTTLTIDPTLYLPYLTQRFLAAGGTLRRGNVKHLSELANSGARAFDPVDEGVEAKPPAAIVVCVGIGARTLGGVEDGAVYPVRGQTVLLRAPWIRFGRTMRDAHGDATYIIPRASGNCIVGGTREADDWHPHPRPETTKDILRRVLDLCPELLPSSDRADNATLEQNAERLLPLVVEEGCGLRPARRGGIRLSVDWISEDHKSRALDAPKPKHLTEGQVVLVHNYGHGGGGFQSSWGSAGVALGLLDGAFEQGEDAKEKLNEWAEGYDGS